jgi:Arc/MetJ-type ribon-helix-helix transcriptional regulator
MSVICPGIMKIPISATIDKDLLDWLESELEDKKRYRNKSHLIEIALEMLKQDREKKR